jgi:hypothetical protein
MGIDFDRLAEISLGVGFEETITYTPSGGSAVRISAIVNRGGISSPSGKTEKDRKFAIDVVVSTADVPTVLVNADRFAVKKRADDVAETTYLAAGLIYSDQGAHRVGLA